MTIISWRFTMRGHNGLLQRFGAVSDFASSGAPQQLRLRHAYVVHLRKPDALRAHRRVV
jgi:hypothetical protein